MAKQQLERRLSVLAKSLNVGGKRPLVFVTQRDGQYFIDNSMAGPEGEVRQLTEAEYEHLVDTCQVVLIDMVEVPVP